MATTCIVSVCDNSNRSVDFDTEDVIHAVNTLNDEELFFVDEEGNTLLHMAIADEEYQAVLALLERARTGKSHASIVTSLKLLLVQNSDGETVLHRAVGMCTESNVASKEILKSIVQFISDLNDRTKKDRILKLLTMKTKRGDTPLHMVSSPSARRILVELAKEGNCLTSIISIKNRAWETPIHVFKSNKVYDVYTSLTLKQ